MVFGQQNACLGGPEFNPQQPRKIARHDGIVLVTLVLRRQPRNGQQFLLLLLFSPKMVKETTELQLLANTATYPLLEFIFYGEHWNCLCVQVFRKCIQR